MTKYAVGRLRRKGNEVRKGREWQTVKKEEKPIPPKSDWFWSKRTVSTDCPLCVFEEEMSRDYVAPLKDIYVYISLTMRVLLIISNKWSCIVTHTKHFYICK